MVLNEICKPGVTDMQIVLHTAESKIKDITKMSFSDIVRIQGDLQANPPSYTLVEEALKNLQYNYVKQKRAEIEAAVREALLR